MRICIWYGCDSMVQGIPQNITGCSDYMVIADYFHFEMHFLSKPSASAILPVEIHAVWQAEIILQLIR